MTEHEPTEDSTPIMPAPVLVDPPTDAIRCIHCGRLTPRPPIARPVPTDGGAALEPRTSGPIPDPNDRRYAETARVDLRNEDGMQ